MHVKDIYIKYVFKPIYLNIFIMFNNSDHNTNGELYFYNKIKDNITNIFDDIYNQIRTN